MLLTLLHLATGSLPFCYISMSGLTLSVVDLEALSASIQGRIKGGGGALGAEVPPSTFRFYLINMLKIIMKFCLSIII